MSSPPGQSRLATSRLQRPDLDLLLLLLLLLLLFLFLLFLFLFLLSAPYVLLLALFVSKRTSKRKKIHVRQEPGQVRFSDAHRQFRAFVHTPY